MADDRLELIASVKNLTSGPIRDIQRSMRALAADSKTAHALGITQAKGHSLALHDLRQQVGGVAERIKTGLAPALGTLGISSLGAAAALAAVSKSLVDFAGNARHLQFMSKQTQLTINQLRAWEQEASRLETTSESLTGGFVTFNEQMEKMRRGGPFIGVRREIEQLRSTLGVFRSGELAKLVQGLQGLGREAQLEKILQFADKIDNISQRRKLLSAFGLDPALANKQSTEILKDLDAIHKALGDLTPQQLKAGTEFQEAIENIKTSLTGLRDAVGAGLAEGVKGVAEEVAKFAANKENIAALNEAINALGGGLGELLKAFRSFTDSPELKSFENFLNVMNNFRPGLWLRDWIGGKGTQKPHEFLKEFTDPHGPPVLDLPLAPVPATPATPTTPAAPISPERIMPAPHQGALFDREQFRGLFQRQNFVQPEGGGGIQPAGFNPDVPRDWAGAFKSPGAGGGDPRAAEGIIESGTLAALRDFAAEQKGAEGGGSGGGGAAGGTAAIRAAYSPSGSGYSGAAQPAGEPTSDGRGGPASSPMGSLPGLGGGADYGRIADAIGKQEGYGRPGTIATDQNNPGNLKWGPFAKAHGATGSGRGGHAIFPNAATGRQAMIDLLKSPKYAGKSIAEIGKTYAEDPKWGAAVARGAGVTPNYIPGSSAIPRISETGRYEGVGGYNFMGSARAAAMGMGDVRAGGPFAHMNFPTGLPKGEGPASITANKYAGADMVGFLKDLHAAGAPLKQFSGVYANRSKRGGGGPSQHAYGNAMDIETGFGSGPGNSPLLYAWAQKHPKEFAEIQAKHHMRNLDTSSGARMHDWGHFEWTPEAKSAAIAGSNAAKSMPNIGAAIGGLSPGQTLDNAFSRSAANERERLRALGGAIHPGGRFGGLSRESFPSSQGFAGRNARGAMDSMGKESDEGQLGWMQETQRGFDPRHPSNKLKSVPINLLSEGRRSGLVGPPMQHKVEGNAHLRVDVHGPATAKMQKMDGMFTKIAINRGRAMPPARQDG